MSKAHYAALLLLVLVAAAWLNFNAWLRPPIAREFAAPELSAWRPEGPRTPSYADYSVIPRPAGWHTMHGDIQESDEMWIAAAPSFELDWVAEPDMFIPEGPTFDNEGRLYFSPLNPREDVSLVVLDAKTGQRLWSLPGAGSGGGAPLILNDPARPGEQMLYHATYEKFWAATTDGEILWQRATGLREPQTLKGELHPAHQWGVNYLPQADAVIGVTMDAYIFAHDRVTGKPLSSPFRLPGSPTKTVETGLPELAIEWGNAASREAFGERVDGISHFEGVLQIIYGGRAQISNAYAVDPHSDRIYIAATAPDSSDGSADGVSANGAIYALELRKTAIGYSFVVAQRYDFVGGSGSTPAVSQDGKRLMVSDELGNVIALNAHTLEEDWRLNVGDQLAASIAIASDNNELYAVTRTDIFKLVDNDDSGELVWTAELDAYPDAVNFNALTPTIVANGVLISQGAGVKVGKGQLMSKVGVGLLDRATGKLRYFAEGREDSISVMSIGPDGDAYTAGSPIRRMAAKGLYGDRIPKIIGGISRYKNTNPRLLAREAMCAAAYRAANSAKYETSHPDSAATDREQIGVLLKQALKNGSSHSDVIAPLLDSDLVLATAAATLLPLCE
ncbi:MAG: PQQ-binding-like beta-propeller repeat protein [Spongiibacteraceae bacterium]